MSITNPIEDTIKGADVHVFADGRVVVTGALPHGWDDAHDCGRMACDCFAGEHVLLVAREEPA